MNEHVDPVDVSVETARSAAASSVAPFAFGVSRAWIDVLRQVERVAATDTTVLITGESGTGKEVIASLVHRRSRRARWPQVAIDCAALPEDLLELQLFGHEKGAFTGAVASRVGRLEQATGGTLFLDEVAEMSPRVQAKFLRVLEEREFQPLGGTRTLRTDVRVIAASRHDLGERVDQNLFRADLYYRLDVFRIHIPPLRERPEDILELADVFLEQLGRTVVRGAASFSPDARAWLRSHSWPGNVRELRNTIERALLLCDGGPITREHLSAGAVAASPAGTGGSSRHAAPDALRRAAGLQVIDRWQVEKALAEAMGRKPRAARLLGLTRAQFYALLERYRLH